MRNLTALQDRPVEVRGKAPWATRVDAALPRPPFTVLCRTNAGVVGAVVTTHEVHRGRVHVVGGVEELVHLLRDAALLKKGEGRTDPHPDLTMVETWEELEALAEAGYAPAYGVLRLVQEHPDLEALAAYLERAWTPVEVAAGVVVSTAHKAKGKGVGPGGPLGRLLPLVGGGGGGEGQLEPGPGPFPPVLCSPPAPRGALAGALSCPRKGGPSGSRASPPGPTASSPSWTGTGTGPWTRRSLGGRRRPGPGHGNLAAGSLRVDPRRRKAPWTVLRKHGAASGPALLLPRTLPHRRLQAPGLSGSAVLGPCGKTTTPERARLWDCSFRMNLRPPVGHVPKEAVPRGKLPPSIGLDLRGVHI
ncbi:hypothetical protein [Thermus thermophilus]|uniref:Uncharacterized protein n=1 Tax=Thermus thermophilus TaxID=274 RepID=A0AAD1KW13_THETH|nr:hypothetical protein [Thermus thermophilus]BCZ88001.1 hypothetical protein TthAA11_21830 [Thermus thermophilus]BCZ95644.1 hypothetical protein TthAK1_22610 [Thermus thermophilus]